MKKRVLSIITVFAILTNITALTAFAGELTDFARDHWSTPYIWHITPDLYVLKDSPSRDTYTLSTDMGNIRDSYEGLYSAASNVLQPLGYLDDLDASIISGEFYVNFSFSGLSDTDGIVPSADEINDMLPAGSAFSVSYVDDYTEPGAATVGIEVKDSLTVADFNHNLSDYLQDISVSCTISPEASTRFTIDMCLTGDVYITECDSAEPLARISFNSGTVSFSDRISDFLNRLNAGNITDFDEIAEFADTSGSVIPFEEYCDRYEICSAILESLSGMGFESLDEFQSAFDEAVFLSCVAFAHDRYTAQEIIERYGDAVGLNLSRYRKLNTQRANAIMVLLGKRFNSIYEMQITLDNICASLDIKPTTSGGGGGGGGGGSTSGGGSSDNITYELQDNGTLIISGSGRAYRLPVDPDSVEAVIIEDGITYIEAGAFSGYYNLKSVSIPESVTRIENNAFFCCSSLESVTIPESVIKIDEQAFEGCDELADIHYAGKKSDWDSIDIESGNDALLNARLYYLYTVTYTGSYEGTDYAYYREEITFPTPPDGYRYSFTVDSQVWDGVVTGDTTVVVSKEYDLTGLDLGTLSFVQAVKDTIIFRLDKTIIGEPTVKILFGTAQDVLSEEAAAEISEDRQTLYISGMQEGKIYYFKAVAFYGDISIESSVVLASTAKLSECRILRVLSPAGGIIDHDNGIVSGLRVMNSVDKITIDVNVSPKATWDLYYVPTYDTTYANKEIPLAAGRTKTAYIRVKAEDGTQKTYSIEIYRQTKSEIPQISVTDGMATITSPDGKNIYYTLDGSTPSEKNGILYEAPFAVSHGTVIRAVAKQEDMDEYSDTADFTVLESDFVTVTPIDVYPENGKLEYEFFVGSSKPIYGVFILAVYDSFGRMTRLIKADTLSGEYEKIINGSLPVSDSEYNTYKVFLWNSFEQMKPLSQVF